MKIKEKKKMIVKKAREEKKTDAENDRWLAKQSLCCVKWEKNWKTDRVICTIATNLWGKLELSK